MCSKSLDSGSGVGVVGEDGELGEDGEESPVVKVVLEFPGVAFRSPFRV
jgi:hypothetical protein